MGKQLTCHGCVYAHWEAGLWMRSLWSGFPARPTCGNQPDSYGRMKECPCGQVCRNYRPKPPVPTGENVKTIPLGDGVYAYVDAADYEWLSQWHWRLYGSGYAGRYEKGKKIFMHRQIMQPPKGKIVDHIDANRANNCRCNLRVCTRPENMHNKRKHSGSSSLFKGVGYLKGRRKWYSRIWFMGERISLGNFDDEVEAARAYDRKAVELLGEFARVNFPEEWPPERRAQAYAQGQKDRGKIRGRKKVRSKESRNSAARAKPRSARRHKTRARKWAMPRPRPRGRIAHLESV